MEIHWNIPRNPMAGNPCPGKQSDSRGSDDGQLAEERMSQWSMGWHVGSCAPAQRGTLRILADAHDPPFMHDHLVLCTRNSYDAQAMEVMHAVSSQ